VSCGAELADDRDARFDVDAGGVACTRCRPTGRVFDAASRLERRAMIEGVAVSGSFADPALQQSLLRAFLTSHLTREHALRSLPLFLEQLG
jgi:hypothetical protein